MCFIINLGCFIIILYHFLLLTIDIVPSASCCFFPCFLHRRKSISDEVQMPRNSTMIFYRPEGRSWALVAPGGSPKEGTTHQGMLGGPGAPWWVVPTSGAPRTATLLYKYPNIPETLGVSTKYSSSHRRVQNHQIQSRHHHGGVHHLHWCLSDDAWVVLCRPSGP